MRMRERMRASERPGWSKGCRPESRMYRMTPRDHMSTWLGLGLGFGFGFGLG